MVLAAVPATGAAGTVSAGPTTLFFQAAAGEVNDVTVTLSGAGYTVTDGRNDISLPAGSGCSQQAGQPRTVTCPAAGIQELSIDGADGDDRLVNATPTPSRIYAGPGDDTVEGGSGNDFVRGQGGGDTIAGNAGDDDLRAEDTGAPDPAVRLNVVDGGDGTDTIYGGPGPDALRGGAATDTIYGDAGDDEVLGGDGNDTLSGGAGRDTIRGETGDDTVGLGGTTGLDGAALEAGDDVLDGGPGDDALDPGRGADLAGGDADTLTGGDGNDSVSYALRTAAVAVSKDGAADDGAATGENDDVAGDVERVVGGAADDVLTGGPGPDTLEGGPGADQLSGLAGADTLRGDDGSDPRLDGGTGDDTVAGGEGNDTLDGQDGADLLQGGASVDTLQGGAGADDLQGDDGGDVLEGGAGPDTMSGGPSDDRVTYASTSPVTVTLDGRDNDGARVGGGKVEGDDVEPDVENVTGGAQDDTFVGAPRDNELVGGAGDDYVDGAGGTDDLRGGSATDVIRSRGDGAKDEVRCGTGFDLAIADRADDVRRSGRERCELVDRGTQRAPAAGDLVFVEPRACHDGEVLGLSLPSARRSVPLEDDVRVPVGSTLTADGCTVDVAASGGPAGDVAIEAQGARFTVRQRGRRAPVTDLVLDGPRCVATTSTTGSAAHHRRPPYSFVAKVTRKRRRARHAVAGAAAAGGLPPTRVLARFSTARAVGAATWVTVERCATTTTRVRSGVVEVRDPGGRTVRLTAGRSHVAR